MVTAEKFYDEISAEYGDSIRRCVPHYDDMIGSLFTYLPAGLKPKRILELGCGSGNLTLLISQYYPDSQIDTVDFSAEIIKLAKERLQNHKINFIKADFAALNCEEGSYDLVISSISIHHLVDAEKKKLFDNIFRWLTKDGLFCFTDQFRGVTDEIYQLHMKRWEKFVIEKGLAETEWKLWMQHQKDHDHHAPLSDHFDWLKSAGFNSVDCTRRFLLWCTVFAFKG